MTAWDILDALILMIRLVGDWVGWWFIAGLVCLWLGYELLDVWLARRGRRRLREEAWEHREEWKQRRRREGKR